MRPPTSLQLVSTSLRNMTLRVRSFAQEARTLANALTDPDAKSKMLKIAEDYEKLAKQRLRHLSSAMIRNWRR